MLISLFQICLFMAGQLLKLLLQQSRMLNRRFLFVAGGFALNFIYDGHFKTMRLLGLMLCWSPKLSRVFRYVDLFKSCPSSHDMQMLFWLEQG
ncbi:hypothetical protein LINPERHAP1_LOCUS31604 [Linum perenne]